MYFGDWIWETMMGNFGWKYEGMYNTMVKNDSISVKWIVKIVSGSRQVLKDVHISRQERHHLSVGWR